MIDDSRRSGGRGLSRRRLVAIALGAAAAGRLVSVTGTPTRAGTAAPRVLTFSDHEPLGGMRLRFLNDVVFPAIERESNGRLKVEAHWDGEVAASYDALGAISQSGLADMATIVPEYTARELPLHQIFKSFPIGPTGQRQVDFFRRVYAEVPALTAELARNNVVPLFFGTGYPVAFFSAFPLANLAELRGSKWRSASFWHQDFLRNAGATPVTMRWGPEIYDALKARALDGLMVNVDSGYMLDVHEAAPGVLVSKDLWLGHLYILAMNQSVWASLAPEDQAAIRRATDSAYPTLGAVMDRSFDEQLADLRQAGATVRVLDPDEPARWATATRYREVQNAWVEEQRGKGITDAGPVLAQVARIMDEVMR